MKKQLRKKSTTALYLWAVLLPVLLAWIIWGNTALVADTAVISNSRIPAPFSGFRIAQVSDLHNAEFGKDNDTLLKLLSENQPDIIVITGDLVDSRRTNMDIALNFVKAAVQIAPVYYVSGNHEASLSQYDTLKTGIEAAGAVVLEDRSVQLDRSGEAVTLMGLSDPNFALRSGILEDSSALVTSKLKGLMNAANGYTILLSHRPELLSCYADCGVDLVFSGHAHGGQFRLPLIGGLVAPNQGLFPPYDAGVFQDRSTDMVVSRGLGNSIIPLRFNNRPEIVIVELRKP